VSDVQSILKRQRVDLSGAIGEVSDVISESKNILVTAESRFAAIVDEIKELQDERDYLCSIHATFDERFVHLEAQLASAIQAAGEADYLRQSASDSQATWEAEAMQFKQERDDARTEVEQLRAQLAAQEQEITQAESVMDKQDEVIGELRARIGELERTLVANEGSNASERIALRASLAALEAAAREGPSDAQCRVILERLDDYANNIGAKDYHLPMYFPHIDTMRAIIRAALATPTTEATK
jgi:chromosome segregation ATPase